MAPLGGRAPGAHPVGHGLELKRDVMSWGCFVVSSPPTFSDNRKPGYAGLPKFPDGSGSGYRVPG